VDDQWVLTSKININASPIEQIETSVNQALRRWGLERTWQTILWSLKNLAVSCFAHQEGKNKP
jgi:hypothetical protein